MDSRKKVERLMEELKKYGIQNEQQLNEALKNMKKINIGCFVAPIPN